MLKTNLFVQKTPNFQILKLLQENTDINISDLFV